MPGIHFFPYQIEDVTNASIQEIMFLLGYHRGKFIGCWTLGTRKLARKFKKVVRSEISASEVRNQEFKALKPLSEVRGHHFRPVFF